MEFCGISNVRSKTDELYEAEKYAGGPSANLPVGFLLMLGHGSSERKDPRDLKGQESVMIHDVPRH